MNSTLVDRSSPFNDRELATVLAALRHWQKSTDAAGRALFEHFEDATPMNDAEVDALCESLNLQPKPARKRTSSKAQAVRLLRVSWLQPFVGPCIAWCLSDAEAEGYKRTVQARHPEVGVTVTTISFPLTPGALVGFLNTLRAGAALNDEEGIPVDAAGALSSAVDLMNYLWGNDVCDGDTLLPLIDRCKKVLAQLPK